MFLCRVASGTCGCLLFDRHVPLVGGTLFGRCVHVEGRVEAWDDAVYNDSGVFASLLCCVVWVVLFERALLWVVVFERTLPCSPCIVFYVILKGGVSAVCVS